MSAIQLHVAIVCNIDENGAVSEAVMMTDVSVRQAIEMFDQLRAAAVLLPQYTRDEEHHVFSFDPGAIIDFVASEQPKEPAQLLREQPVISKQDIDEVYKGSGPAS